MGQSYFTLTVDTKSPTIEIFTPQTVLSSGVMHVSISADELLEPSYQNFYMIDSLGERHDLIFTYMGMGFDGEVQMSNFPTGIATIYAQVKDSVENMSQLVQKVINVANGIKINAESYARVLTMGSSARVINSDSYAKVLFIESSAKSLPMEVTTKLLEMKTTITQ